MIQLLHDGDLLLDQFKGIVFPLGGRVSVQWRIEAYASRQSAPSISGSAKEVRLGAFAQARLGELFDGIFLAILVDGEVDCAERASSNLLLDQVLVDAVLGGAVIFAVAVLGARIEGFLLELTTKLEAGMNVSTLTRRVLEAARRWCRRGLWYAGVDLAICQHLRGAALT